MSLPDGGTRADVVQLFPAKMVGFEIKSAADGLRRLERQAAAYEAVFAECFVVTAPRHVAAVTELLSPWWGIVTTTRDGSQLRTVRRAATHGLLRAEALVQLLWREEALRCLTATGKDVPRGASRAAIWQALTSSVDVAQLHRLVAQTMASRTPESARIVTRWSSRAV
jgi:hypothetical protein